MLSEDLLMAYRKKLLIKPTYVLLASLFAYRMPSVSSKKCLDSNPKGCRAEACRASH
jgi:hypothetical protein